MVQPTRSLARTAYMAIYHGATLSLMSRQKSVLDYRPRIEVIYWMWNFGPPFLISGWSPPFHTLGWDASYNSRFTVAKIWFLKRKGWSVRAQYCVLWDVLANLDEICAEKLSSCFRYIWIFVNSRHATRFPQERWRSNYRMHSWSGWIWFLEP